MKIHFPLRTAIAGIGGFANAHHGIFANLEERHLATVVATCDPALDNLGGICETRHFASRGVSTYTDFDAMIRKHEGSIDLGVVATPIHLHGAMHEAFVRCGAACYLEKPPTLDPVELQRMLEVEEGAVLPTNVGFSFVHLADRLKLKSRMVDGEFGALKRMSFLGLAQRLPSYFSRNTWAGKLLVGKNLLLDSCLGNALAHFLNNMLFFGNQSGVQAWARPESMECELYRANPIEGTDTIFAICTLDNEVELRLAASHACSNPSQITEERMEFEKAIVTIRATNQVTIERPGSATESFDIADGTLAGSLDDYFAHLKNASARPAQTLRDCVGFVEANALFYLAAGRIHTIAASALHQDTADSAICLCDVAEAANRLIREGTLPSKAGFQWAAPGGHATIRALPRLRETIQDIASRSSTNRTLPCIVTDMPEGCESLHIYCKKTEGLQPFVLGIHGGGWMRGDQTSFNWIWPTLSPLGVALVLPSYRKAPDFPFPAAYEDLLKVCKWIAMEGHRHGLDASRGMLMGSSAGAHLAMLLATRGLAENPAIPPFRGVACYCGPMNLLTQHQSEVVAGRGTTSTFLGSEPNENPNLYHAASPEFHIHKKMPPAWLAHGSDDKLVPASQSQNMAAALQINGHSPIYLEARDVAHTMVEIAPDGTLIEPHVLLFEADLLRFICRTLLLGNMNRS
jgi:acetyl esterase/lipase/predicted dehydrogenase